MRNISSDDELLGSVTKVSTLCGAQVEYMATLMNRNFTRHPVKREQPSPCNIMIPLWCADSHLRRKCSDEMTG